MIKKKQKKFNLCVRISNMHLMDKEEAEEDVIKGPLVKLV